MTGVVTADGVSVRRVTPSDGHYLCGYYDVSPWNRDGTELLTHRVSSLDRLPEPGETAVLCLVHPGGETEELATTSAWNFQLGSMAQWLGPDRDRYVAFNDRDDGAAVTRILDTETGDERSVDGPLYCATPDGTTGFGVSFERLHQTRRGYGHAVPGSASLAPAPADDGIVRLDLADGGTEVAVSLDRLSDNRPLPSMEGATHWVNHLALSPSGRRLAFLHRWSLPDGMYTRLCVTDPDGERLRTVVDTGRVTHYAWVDDETLLAWTREQEQINAATKGGDPNPLVSAVLDVGRYVLQNFPVPEWVVSNVVGEQYRLYDIDGEVTSEPFPIHARDGHPVVADDGRRIAVDTYPTAAGRRELLVCHDGDPDATRVAAFPTDEPRDGTARRCDLHPRWGPSPDEITVDSAHEETRGVYVVTLP